LEQAAMAFQFLCPQGHLLEGDEAHMGMACQCPQCGTTFIIPTVEQKEAPAAATDWAAEERVAAPTQRPAVQDLLEELQPSLASSLEAHDESLLHIPCPNGHELDVPLDMVGQEVLCPHCYAQFRLLRRNSVEYLREQELRDRARIQFWFKWAKVVAVIAGIMLFIMFIMALVN
jgi:hypothetical protein